MFDTTHAHPDGRALLAEFLERDARGEFLQSDPWFRGATDCPGHEPGWDTHAVITSYELAAQRVKDSLWLGIVTSHEVGWVSYGGPPKYEPFLSIDVRDAIDTLRAIRTRFGWRIEGPQRAQRVLLSDPRSARVREEYSDSLARLGIH